MNALRVADLFCGAGGLSLGFRDADFDLKFSADNDFDSVETYRANLGAHVHQLDLSKGSASSLAAMISTAVGDIDVLVGGPPCQGFSMQGRGDIDDDRNDLLLRHVRIGIALGAKAVAFENVPTVLGPRGRKYLDTALAALARGGYSVNSAVLQAADFGVPQLRRRAFVVAIKRNAQSLPFDFPSPLRAASEYVTVREAFSGLPPPPEDFSEHVAFENHQRRKISDTNLERISFVPEGGGRLDIPARLRLPCHAKDDGHRHLDVYGRMWWDRPAPTITAMFDNFSRGRFAHPTENRNITNREGARLQSFPDSFVFMGDKKSVARQIGNAVPPLLAHAVAKAISRSLGLRPEQHIVHRPVQRVEYICAE